MQMHATSTAMKIDQGNELDIDIEKIFSIPQIIVVECSYFQETFTRRDGNRHY